MAAYRYDALGRRIEYVDYTRGVTTRYYYDGQNVIAEYDESDAVQRSYVHGSQYVDERAVMRDHASTAAYHDHYCLLGELYTVVGMADCRGWMEEMYVYDTYGGGDSVRLVAGRHQPQRYCRHQRHGNRLREGLCWHG